jgi:VWFA-related protein
MKRLVLIVSSCATLAAAAQQPAERQTFRSGREILTIEVAVRSGDGTPLTDLKSSDFAVRLDGQPRSVVGSELFASRQGAPGSAAAAPAVAGVTRNTETSPGRVVVFAVDRMSIHSGGEIAAVNAAARLVEGLSPSDAVGAIGIPGAVTEVSRDHAAALEAIRHMTGTAVAIPMTAKMSWQEALDSEMPCRRSSKPTQACITIDEVLMEGRAQAVTTLSNIESVVDRLTPLRAPKSLVVLSGGIPFDQTLVDRYRTMAQRAARSHTTLFIIHLDQNAYDASSMGIGAGGMAKFGSGGFPPDFFGGRDYETGLAAIASLTGGEFFYGVGAANGVFDRISSELTYFYQLGIESTAADADGKTHRIEVTVSRPGAKVRAPTETALQTVKGRTPVDTLKAALAEPTDVTEVPLEVATYVMHSGDPAKVRVMIAASTPDSSQVVPQLWGSTVLDGNKVAGAVGSAIDAVAPVPWTSTGIVELAPGKYRLRTAVVAGGRVGTLELPLTAGLRAMGEARASDLVVGVIEQGRLEPRAHLTLGDMPIAMVELSASKPLEGLAGSLLLTPSGADTPIARRPLTFRLRSDDKAIVLGEARFDPASVPPGRYAASVIVEQSGKAIGRVSRMVDIGK